MSDYKQYSYNSDNLTNDIMGDFIAMSKPTKKPKRMSAVALTEAELKSKLEALEFEGYEDITHNPYYDYELELKTGEKRLMYYNIFYTDKGE